MYDFTSMNPILIAAAVIPAVFLLIQIYKLDKLEREPMGLLLNLAVWGVLATILAMFLESVGEIVMALMGLDGNSLVGGLFLYFIVVGGAEEGAKYFLLKKRTWNTKEFNCKFDAIIYATYVSLGFALWENIGYVTMYGLSNALIRAATAIPGHASFGVFMGIFYGLSKAAAVDGNMRKSKSYGRLAFWVPVFFHGTYDFLATRENMDMAFTVFTLIMFIIAYVKVKDSAKKDKYFQDYEDLDISYYLKNNNPNRRIM